MKKGILLLPLCAIFNGYAGDERINIAEIVVSHPNNSGGGLSSQKNHFNATLAGAHAAKIINPNNYNYNEDDLKHFTNVPVPRKVNVHTERTPYRKILKRTGEGLVYGAAAGCLLGLLYYTYTQPKSIRDAAYVASVGGLGFGLAGATWYGTRQTAKAFNKRDLTKARTTTVEDKKQS